MEFIHTLRYSELWASYWQHPLVDIIFICWCICKPNILIARQAYSFLFQYQFQSHRRAMHGCASTRTLYVCQNLNFKRGRKESGSTVQWPWCPTEVACVTAKSVPLHISGPARLNITGERIFLTSTCNKGDCKLALIIIINSYIQKASDNYSIVEKAAENKLTSNVTN